MSEIQTLVTGRTIKGIQELFEANLDMTRTGWEMHDSAVSYFGRMYFDSLDKSLRDCRQYGIAPPTTQELTDRSDMYNRIFNKVVLARQVLEQKQPGLLNRWANVQGTEQTVTDDTIASLLAEEGGYQLGYKKDLEWNDWHDECLTIAQWLSGWVRSETVKEQS